MVISVIGDTDKRPIMYTLLNLCQKLGDVLLVTKESRYSRFVEDDDTGDDLVSGFFQNVYIIISSLSADEVQSEAGYNRDDYEYIIYDNILDSDSDLILYVQGCEKTLREESVLEYLDDSEYTTWYFGFGKKNKIQVTSKMYLNCEVCEAKKVLLPIDNKLNSMVCKLIAQHSNIPEKNLLKLMNSK